MEAKLNNAKFGFIGAGNMAYAIAQGLIRSKIIKKITAVSGPHPEKYREKWGEFTEMILDNNSKVLNECNYVFLCVKPNLLEDVASQIDLPKHKTEDIVIVSVLAATSKAILCSAFPHEQIKIVRIMPNICVQVGEGCCIVAENEDSTAEPKFIDWIFNQIGTSVIVPEEKFEAYPGLTGCGPAYIFNVIDALADGAVKQGVPREQAIKLAAQTVCGAAKTQLITGKHPAVLKDEVCSPGGTTIAGVHALEIGGLRATMINAVQAATERSKSMSQK